MKKLFGRNQIMIASLALMIAVAGYLNFLDKGEEKGENAASESEEVAMMDISLEDIASLDSDYVEADDEYLSDADMDTLSAMETEGLNAFISQAVDSDAVEGILEGEEGDVALNEEGTELNIDEVPGEAVFTSVTAVNNLADARLAKEQIRAKNKELLQSIIDNASLSEEQKSEAVATMISLTDIAEREMSSEILLESKGFKNAVVSITGETADVCIASESLSDIHRAQIIDIVQRKAGISAENIVITPVTN
ncbi:MAG: SpoIIIAH-like family protein [Lachnospiraceae bacterium]|nr:SpoIIIAH-like family protein [Lachnospiraceae bacterium]